jgi:hypothetical protein
MVDGLLPARGSNRADRPIDKPVAPLFRKELEVLIRDEKRSCPSRRSTYLYRTGGDPSATLGPAAPPACARSLGVSEGLCPPNLGGRIHSSPVGDRLSVSVTAKNVLGHKHREFVGAPALGRLVIARRTYELP